MKALIIPEECDNFFSIPPRDLPGQIMLNHAYCAFVSWSNFVFYCRRPNGPESRNIWTRVGEDTTVFDPQGNGVGIKLTYALTEQEEESDVISLPGGIEPPREE